MLTLFRAHIWQSPLRLLRLAWRVLLNVASRVTRQLDRWFPALSRFVAGCCGCCRRTRIGESATPAFAPAIADLDEVLNEPGPPAPSLIEPPIVSSSHLSLSRSSSSTLGSLRSSGRGGAALASGAEAEGPVKRSITGARISHTPDLNEAPPHLTTLSSRMDSPRVRIEEDHKPPAPPRESQWKGGNVVSPPPSPPEPQLVKHQSMGLELLTTLAGKGTKAQEGQGSNEALELTKSVSISSPGGCLDSMVARSMPAAAAPPPSVLPPTVLPLRLGRVQATAAAAAAPSAAPRSATARATAPKSARLATLGYRGDFDAADTLEPEGLEAAPEDLCTPAVHGLRSFDPAAVRAVLHPIALQLCTLFGFQKAQPSNAGTGTADAWVRSNLDNQVEHLLGLLLCRMDSCDEETIETALMIAVRHPPRETLTQPQPSPQPQPQPQLQSQPQP